jgi:glycosyltransferase involved in cell wall biosynthesis
MDHSIGISVVMPVYNTPTEYVKEAVDSILGQTFGNFEFIIIDDGSTNGNAEYLDGINDGRVRIIRNPNNIGITKSLNIGLRAARGKYIARMDADDISLPWRFEKQFSFMEAHPDVIMCGSRVSRVGAPVPEYKPGLQFSCDMKKYRVTSLFRYPGPNHPTVFFNRELLLKNDLEYDERLKYAQDYGIYCMIAEKGKICILEECLLLRRVHNDRITCEHRAEQIECDKVTERKLLEKLLGIISDEELDFHFHCSSEFEKEIMTPGVISWYRRIRKANHLRGIYDRRLLRKEIVFIESHLIHNLITGAHPLRKKIGIVRYIFTPALYKLIATWLKAKTVDIIRKVRKESR